MKIKYLLLIIIYKNYNMNNDHQNNCIKCLQKQLQNINNVYTIIKNFFIERKMNSNTSIKNISETLTDELNGGPYLIISEKNT